ncbi:MULTISPECIES: hypothetical protein [Aliivibrio]|nr:MULTISPECIES: hypothetical protein [Aliivibrio]MBD1567930.1 hypothetical protein [Aliivibrio sp. S10_S31]MUH95197.1 hypothetical protein [Aliivibrio fischeri]MUI65115.1 hypothetical protein [Aliivibrio fischeri]
MMQRQEFIAKMAIAYMEHHGCLPSSGHLGDWSALWGAITGEAGAAR